MSRTARLGIALGLNLALAAVQVVYGLAAHSLGLLSDAGHNLTDLAAVSISLVAVRYARRAPTEARSYGYHRGTILAAVANVAVILAVTVVIVAEAIRRLAHPSHVHGGVVVAVALAGFVVNAAAGAALHEPIGPGHHGHDLNMRSAFLHMGADALASLGVAAAGLVILLTGRFERLDAAVSIGIAALIAFEAYRLARQATDVLLESTPQDLDVTELTGAIVTVEGVDSMHDLHVWSLSSEIRALSAHLVLTGHPTLEEAQVVGDRVKQTIAGPFSIAHTTLELECEPCADGEEAQCNIDPDVRGGLRDRRQGAP